MSGLRSIETTPGPECSHVLMRIHWRHELTGLPALDGLVLRGLREKFLNL